MGTQQIAALARQVIAVLALVFGILTQALSAIHLPPAISATMAALGGGILAVEHYLSDPSTGRPPTPPAP